MRLIADLHIHSKYSRSCGKNLDLKNLEKYARLKGIDLLGTGDFTHPEWIKELKTELTEDGSGILKTKSGFPFVLQTELSLIYKQDNVGHKVHNIVLAPNFETVDKITEELLKRGRVDYDGRPIFKIPCPEFVRMLKQINPRIEIIPAHIWTPHFAMLGSKSGFNSLAECFGDQAKHIHAIETGLSSDPQMNWRIPELDNIQLVSFSDLHSFWPWRIGREATVFNIDLTYDSLIQALHTGNGIIETYEVNPNYGKYHLDGHRKCNILMEPEESEKFGKICPVCKKPMIIGVLNRVEELAQRPSQYRPQNAKPFRYIISLHELLAIHFNKGVDTKTVWNEYEKIMKIGKNEFDVLLNKPFKELTTVTSEEIAQLIVKNRDEQIFITPGYDGVYGEPIIDENKIASFQKNRKDYILSFDADEIKRKFGHKIISKIKSNQEKKDQKGLSEFFC